MTDLPDLASLLAKWENPFFRREARQLARRPGALLIGMLSVSVTLGFALLLCLAWSAKSHRSTSAATGWLLLVPHTALCMVAGVYGTDRIFADEHRRGTLEGLLFLPISPFRWVAMRLAAPLYGVLLAWIAGLPIYLTGIWAGLVTYRFVEEHAWVPPVAGLSVIPVLLLFPPDYRERLRRARLGGAGRRADVEVFFGSAIVAGLGTYVMLLLAKVGTVLSGGTVSWFAISLPGWLPTLVVSLLLVAAAAAGARSILTGEVGPQSSRSLRVALLTAVYYADAGIILGSAWSYSAFWLRWGPVGIYPLVMFWMLRGHTRPKEDPLSASEVDYAARLSGNSLLVRDFRVYTRFTSVRKAIVREVGILALAEAVLYYLIVWRGRGGLTELLVISSICATLVGIMVVVGEMSLRPFSNWNKERTGASLPLLFLIPQPSRSILHGRLVGAMIYALAVHLPLIVVSAAAIAWAIGREWMIGAYLLAFSPILLLFVIVLGCTVQPLNAPPWQWNHDDWCEVGLSILQIVLLFGELYFSASWREGGPAIAWAMAALTCLTNASIVAACYFLRARQFEALRSGSRELRER